MTSSNHRITRYLACLAIFCGATIKVRDSVNQDGNAPVVG